MDPNPHLVEAIYRDYGDFCQRRGEASEADTRANIIDRLIHDVLGWPRNLVSREEHVQPGYLDYHFRVTAPIMVCEAKASGVSFVLPYRPGNTASRQKIDGSLRANALLQSALLQVQRYCTDSGARYGLVTNGYTFALFRAIMEREAWRSGDAVVFSGPKVLINDFATFWNLLSFDAVRDGRLDDAFRAAAPASRGYHRPIDHVITADATYGRNAINNALRPYAAKFFGDLSQQSEIDILEHCYVHSQPLQQIDDDLAMIIRDHVPRFATAAKQLHTSDDEPGGEFEQDLRRTVKASSTGTVVLFMGGIGAGKTTFLRRFFSIVVKDLLKPGGPVSFAALDFLGAPTVGPALDVFLWKTLKDQFVAGDPSVVSRATLEAIAEDRLKVVRETYRDDQRLQERLNDHLFSLVSAPQDYCEALLRYQRSQGRIPVIVFDNVDQLSVEAQSHIFTTAEYFSHHLKCVSVLVMREESYCTAQLRKQLTAYTIRPYHLSSPRFRDMVRTRLDFAANEIARQDERKAAEDTTYKEILEFFQMMRSSVFDRNRNIVRLIEAVSYGNMRLALDLFNAFILSGATNTPEMLGRFRISKTYVVPFHQFCKSVMLGDYRYYKESRSLIANLFHITQSRNASHFTSLRVLSICAGNVIAGKDGEGFCDLQDVVNAVVDYFDNEHDCVETIVRLVGLGRQLLELDTRRSDSLDGANAVRITSAGRYYLQYLANAFAYLDLVWQDTAIEERAVADRLTATLRTTELQERLSRVELFLEYLAGQEKRELAKIVIGIGPHFTGPFMPRIARHVSLEKRFIERSRSPRS